MVTKRLKLLILVVFSIIILIGLGSIVYAACPHGVTICPGCPIEVSYDCSPVSDGRCPEDYGATCCTSGCGIWDDDCGQKCCVDANCTAVCRNCDASYQCNELPPDDSACGTIDCYGWYVQTGTEGAVSTENCYNKLDITSSRCEALGDCKDANTTDCSPQANDILQYSCGTCKYISASDCTGTTLGSCTNYAVGTDSGLCRECDGAGSEQVPADDTACGTIDCDGLNGYLQFGTESPSETETCYYRDYADLTSNRCKDLGDCKDANSPDCVSYSDSPQYTCDECKYIGASDCTGGTLGTCTNYAQGTSCPDDGDSCTDDYCDNSGGCINPDYCAGTDTTCGCTSCINCNTDGTGAGPTGDDCLGDSYIDYYCSDTSCDYTSDDCSDCSCSCGNYNLASEAGFCTDGKDNDCDTEWDYDTMNRGGGSPPHGDDNCPVGVASATLSADTIISGSAIDITCTLSTVVSGGVNSIFAYLDNNNNGVYDSGDSDFGWVEASDGWSADWSEVYFRNRIITGAGTKYISCGIYSSPTEPFDRSYQSGSDAQAPPLIVIPSNCSPRSEANCEFDGACKWIDQCRASSPEYSGAENRCINITDPDPTYTCSYANCKETCDGSYLGDCGAHCGSGGEADIRYYVVNCNSTCECNYSTENCSYNYDCLASSLDCLGAGESILTEVGDNYICSVGSCITSGTITCNGPWICDADNEGGVQMCKETDYTCLYDNGWKWFSPKAKPYKETNCTDTYDNDNDNLTDCNDSDCVGICPGCPLPENCTDDLDNDCDGLIDGCDNNCSEGQGLPGSANRCCDEGGDNDEDGLYDMEDPGCCDFCLADPAYGFDNFTGQPCGIGCDCGGLIFNWEKPITMVEYCCGDDSGENFINTTIGLNTYYACCNNPGDCVDANGDCQIGTEELFELCTNGVDDDCDGLVDRGDDTCQGVVTGYVFDEDGFPVVGALVKGSPPSLGTEYESNATTGPLGGYTITDPLVGEYSFVARKEGYDDKVIIINVIVGTTTQVNFTIRNGSCHEDCTDYYGNCNPSCHGVPFAGSNCTFISPLCYGRPEGFIIRNTTGNTVQEYTCCEGPMRTYPVLTATITGEVENLYDYVMNVKLGGRYVRMHILVWKPEE